MTKASRLPVRALVLALLFLLSVITYVDRVCIAVAGPRIQSEMAITPQGWGWIVGAFTLGYALFEIPTGSWADRAGARRVLTRIVLWWSLFTAATGMVNGFAALLVVRFLFGAGEAGAYPAAASAVSRWFPRAERSRAAGVVWMASRIGATISPLVVVPLQRAWGWRASFFAFAGAGVVWSAAWWLWFRDRPRDKRGVPPSEIELVERETDAPSHAPVAWRSLVRRRDFWTLLALYHAYCWGAYFYFSWLHTYLQKGRGMSEDSMRLWSSLPFLVGAAANLVGGAASDALVRRRGLRFGRRVVGTVGLCIGAACLLGVGLTRNATTAAVLLCIGLGGMDAFLPVAWAVALDVGGARGGAITGAMNMAGQLGATVSSIAFGYFVSWFGGYDAAVLPLAGMVLIAAALFATVDPTRPMAA